MIDRLLQNVVDLKDLRQRLMSSVEFRKKGGQANIAPPTDAVARADRIREFVTKDSRGIEIGPWFNPLCPKSAGYNVLTADVFSQEELRARAEKYLNAPAALLDAIEYVDFVGTGSQLGTMAAARGEVGAFDYVISAHNLEHIPDPIRFLQGCSHALKPGGVISMALPDRRAGGDFFRSASETGELLEAYWEQRTKPSPAQIFSHVALGVINSALEDQATWVVGMDTSTLKPMSTMQEGYRIALDHAKNPEEPYFDSHCWVFTPRSFELVIGELRNLGMIGFSVKKIVSWDGWEFVAHLVKDEVEGAGQLSVSDRLSMQRTLESELR